MHVISNESGDTSSNLYDNKQPSKQPTAEPTLLEFSEAQVDDSDFDCHSDTCPGNSVLSSTSSHSDIDHSSDNVDDDICDTTSSTEFLRTWALRNNITHKSLSELLTWFATTPNISGLAGDARTLLKTFRTINIISMGNGGFFYFGLAYGVGRILKNVNVLFEECILDFNIDGIPLHKSTNESFWPILCRIYNVPLCPPFPIAIYCGTNKPPLEEYLSEFVTELMGLMTNGITVNGKHLQVVCRSFCCDAPARAFVKGTKGHNSYMSCDKCCVRGTWVSHKMVFTNLDSTG